MPVTVSIRRLQPLRSQLPDTDGDVDIVAGPLAGEARGGERAGDVLPSLRGGDSREGVDVIPSLQGGDSRGDGDVVAKALASEVLLHSPSAMATIFLPPLPRRRTVWRSLGFASRSLAPSLP